MESGYRTRPLGAAAILDARHAFRMVGMKNYYMEIDGMAITCGDIRREGLADIVPYYVERDDGEGDFDFAEGSLPTCTPMRSRGFTESELWEIESLMRDNMPVIHDDLRGVGAWS